MKRYRMYWTAWDTHRRNTLAREGGVKFDLTYEEWLSIWKQSGHLEERGIGKDKYCMARISDVGGYTLKNVVIITNSQNAKENWKRRIQSLSERQKRSKSIKHYWDTLDPAKRRDRTKHLKTHVFTEETKLKMARTNSEIAARKRIERELSLVFQELL